MRTHFQTSWLPPVLSPDARPPGCHSPSGTLEVRQGDGVSGGTQRALWVALSDAPGLGWGTTVSVFKPFVIFRNGFEWRVVLA